MSTPKVFESEYRFCLILDVYKRQAVHGRRVDRGRGADRQSHSGGNLRCADLRTVQSLSLIHI